MIKNYHASLSKGSDEIVVGYCGTSRGNTFLYSESQFVSTKKSVYGLHWLTIDKLKQFLGTVRLSSSGSKSHAGAM